MSHVWFVSIPGTSPKVWSGLNAVTEAKHLSSNSKFVIPSLRVGTLDSLMEMSEALAKTDQFCENVIRKMSRQTKELLCSSDVAEEASDVLTLRNGLPIQVGLTKFAWNDARYPTSETISNLTEKIDKHVLKVDDDLKTKSTSYLSIKGTIASIDRKQQGNLSIRPLSGLVDHCKIVDTEYLVSAAIAVPKNSVKTFEEEYETACDNIVPRSIQLVQADKDFSLYLVVVFRKNVDDLKKAGRERRWIVRDCEFKPEEAEATAIAREKLDAELQIKWASLFKWLKSQFIDAFQAWVHVKAMRVFVESCLRYGVPPEFTAAALQTTAKTRPTLRKVLNETYKSLDPSWKDDSTIDDAMAYLASGDYYPYVSVQMNLDIF